MLLVLPAKNLKARRDFRSFQNFGNLDHANEISNKSIVKNIQVHVSLYGSLARYQGGKHVAITEVKLPAGACKADLLAHLGIQNEERGYLFINAVLCDVPGLVTGEGQVLKEGDHVGIFSVDRIWPYQYRDGVRMSEELTEALKIHGAMHHSYHHLPKEANSRE